MGDTIIGIPDQTLDERGGIHLNPVKYGTKLRNDDSPLLRRGNEYLPGGSPHGVRRLGSCSAEVMTSTYPQRTEVVSTIHETRMGPILSSQPFEDNFKRKQLVQEIIDKHYPVVHVRAIYEEKISKEDWCYEGTGILVKKNNEYFVITARHNILSKRNSKPKQKLVPINIDPINLDPTVEKEHDLFLKEIKIMYPGIQKIFRYATRHNHPVIVPSLREKHIIMDGYRWPHNSDYATLKVQETGSNVSRFKFEDPRSHIVEICTDSILNVGDEVFVYGIPCSLSEEEYKEKFKDSSRTYQELLQTFSFEQLNVSYGKIVEVTTTLCTYDANTAGGMSGGPVFLIKEGKLTPIGLHVGGNDRTDQNYFIPFSMPEFKNAWENV